jgi:hypothetical protein
LQLLGDDLHLPKPSKEDQLYATTVAAKRAKEEETSVTAAIAVETTAEASVTNEDYGEATGPYPSADRADQFYAAANAETIDFSQLDDAEVINLLFDDLNSHFTARSFRHS